MSESNNNTGRRDHLISFSYGDTLRYIQSEYNREEKYENIPNTGWCQHFYSIQNNKLLSSMVATSNLKNYYFMNNETNTNSIDSIKVPLSMFSVDFLDFMSKSVNDNDNKIYFEKDWLNLSENINKLSQCNDKCYMLKNNSYTNYENSPHYEIKQYTTSLNFDSLLSTYISEKYSPDYYDKSHNVSDKSVPIYSLNEDALRNIHVLRVENNEDLLYFIDSIGLTNSKSNFLFNADTWTFDEENFNAIHIDRFLDSFNSSVEYDYTTIFKKLLSFVKYESFYRFLNPIGKIRKALSIDSEDIEQYVYSPDLTNRGLSIDVNYFSLKNLENPNCEYIYSCRNRQYDSVKQTNYSYEMNTTSIDAVSYARNVIDEFNSLIENHNSINSYENWKINNTDESMYKYYSYLLETYNLQVFNLNYGYSTLRKREIYDFLKEKSNSYPRLLSVLEKYYNWKDIDNVITLTEQGNVQNDISIDSIYNDLSGITIGMASAFLENHGVESRSNYIEQYYDLFERENEFTKYGELFGNRKYVNILHGDQEKLFFVYKYSSTFDDKLLKKVYGIDTHIVELYEQSYTNKIFDFNEKENVDIGKSLYEITSDGDIAMIRFDVALIIAFYSFIIPNMLNAKLNIKVDINEILEKRARAISSIKNYEITELGLYDDDNETALMYMKRISENEVVLYGNKISNVMKSFFEMTSMMNNFENIEAVNGSFYYKETRTKKSNVFSLRFNNSGLEYDSMNFDECISYMNGIMNSSYDKSTRKFILKNGTEVEFEKAMLVCNVDKILLDKSIVSFESNMLSDNSYIYITYDDRSELENLKKQIRTKYYLRSLLETSIRNNISKYIPVETTLWKIEYSNNK